VNKILDDLRVQLDCDLFITECNGEKSELIKRIERFLDVKSN